MARVSTPFLKALIWFKLALLGVLVLYTLLFIFNNSVNVRIWLFFNTEPEMNLLLALLGTFLLGSLLTLLVRTIQKTLAQMRTARERSRSLRLEREIADMRTKAATLQPRE